MNAPAVKECLDFAVANGEELDTCNAAALQLRELLRRDWAVRVLDAWADDWGWETSSQYSKGKLVGWFVRDLRAVDPVLGRPQPTRAAARLAAAEAVWPELPESVRAELGGRDEFR